MKPAKCLFLLLAVVYFTQSACKKTETPKEKTRTELLTQKPWILTKWRYNYMGGDWIDEFVTQPACAKDDIFAFKTDQTCVRDLGAIKCYQDSPQFLMGKWSGIEGYIKLENVAFDEVFTFRYLGEDALILSGSRTSGVFDEYTFVHP